MTVFPWPFITLTALSVTGLAMAGRSRHLAEAAMVLELEAPSTTARGRPVTFTVRLRNAGEQPVELALTGNPPAFDIVVSRNNSQVWSRLHNTAVPMVLQLKTFKPGETMEFKARWDQRDNKGRPVPSGTYTVSARMAAEPAALTSEAKRLVIGR